MTCRLLSFSWSCFVFLMACCWTCGHEQAGDESQAIAAIQKMGGQVVRDQKRTSKPVTEVHLYAGKTKGIGLQPLTQLPEIEWIGLHLSDITEADLVYLQQLHKL